MILGNVNDHLAGERVVMLDTRTRAIPANFPGWGHPQAASFLQAIPEGATGTVRAVESHGAAPHTRYTVRYDDGSRAAGLAWGVDFLFVSGAREAGR